MLTVSSDLRSIPIPLRENIVTTAGYRSVSVDLTTPYSNDSLVDLGSRGVQCDSYYARDDALNPPYYRPIVGALKKVLCRRGLAHKLIEVNQLLIRYRVELLVLDSYRPIACQQGLFEYFRQAAPPGQDSEAFARVYCSDPQGFDPHDSMTWPTHITGGATDVTLCRLGTREILFMGGVFDDPSEGSHTDYFERMSESDLSASAIDARGNRRLLYHAMNAAGLANYGYEWWHYDWGTQMWVTNWTKSIVAAGGPAPQVAFYGPAHYRTSD